MDREIRRNTEDFIARMIDDFDIERDMLHKRLAEMDAITVNVLAAWMR